MTRLVLKRRFWALFGAQTLGAFADNTLRNATILAVIGAAGLAYGSGDFTLPFGAGRYAGSIVSAGFTLPVLLFSGIAGQLADKVDRHILVRRLKFVELGLMSFAALCFALGNAPLLIFSLFLMGAQSAFFSPVRTSLMPQYYRGREITLANGLYNAALFVAIVTGLALGGYLITIEGGRLMVSGTLIGAASLGALLATQCPRAPVKGDAPIRWNVLLEAVRQFRLVGTHHGLIYPLLGIGWFWMMSAASLAILPNVVKETLGAGDNAINLCLALSALGAGLGSMLAGVIALRVRDSFLFAGVAVAANAIAWIVAWAVLGDYRIPEAGFFTWGNWPLMAVLTAAAATNGMFVVPLMAALQSRAPRHIRATVMGVSNMTNGGLATLAAIMVIPPLFLGVPPHGVFLGFALMQAGLLAFMWRRKGSIRAGANPLTADVVTATFKETGEAGTYPAAK